MNPRPWYGPGHHNMHQGLGWGGWTLWVLFMIALLALVIMAIIWLARSLSAHRQDTGIGAGTGTASAEQILAERFAHGQIDENEYRTRLAVLRGGQPTVAQGPPPSQPPPAGPPPAPPPPASPPAPPAPPAPPPGNP
ncbi:hypothetical protein [Catenulispora subtropica]|uniref:SHOCT domain-containing protein n=1 Tax=Catenulispora subtropica TaxID=450798 RepID=A0ABP5D3C7_9ACTN